jgi:hypothetical protein
MSCPDRSTVNAPAPTHFAPAERTDPEVLRLEAEACLSHPVACFLMHALDGLVLILDAQRQVLATNERVLEILDAADGTPFGRRPGELFGCIHVPEGPGGCGTSHACAHCGAVLAVLEAQRSCEPVRSECHRAMAQAEHGQLTPRMQTVLPQELLVDVWDLLSRHALAKDRKVTLLPAPGEALRTDPELLARVVLNMAVNAMEASASGDTITLSARLDGPNLQFQVHNPGQIPEAIQTRIFQRSFSTKGTAGRGLGTYAMKLFGESVLHGQVGFDSGPGGTTFWIRIPRQGEDS